jgi:putative redox protein
MLAGRLERPPGPVRAYAIFAHCFTCGKDVLAAARISRALTSHGFAVLRFDFTGLGASEGEFENSNFSSNVADVVAAADHLRRELGAPQLLVGHSLGGAAVISAAARVPEVRAVATIAAPSHPSEVERHLTSSVAEIEREGRAEVSLAGRKFFVQRQFLEDVRNFSQAPQLGLLGRALIVLHSPLDSIVSIDSAERLFAAAPQPKSFVSLDTADHLLSQRADAAYVAGVLAAWAERYLDPVPSQPRDEGEVVVEEAGVGRYTQRIFAGAHTLTADEPQSMGGDDRGPTPYQLLMASLGACTSITLRMYAERKQLALSGIRIRLRHAKIHAADCAHCETQTGKLDEITRELELTGELTPAERARLLEIANKCPVHRTLHSELSVQTRLSESPALV